MKKIFILHGWQYNTDNWKDIVEMFSKKKYDVHLLKVPGLTEKIDREWNIEDYCDWLKDVLPKNERFILIGHSNGGRLATYFTYLYGDRVEKLVLIGSAGIFDRRIYPSLKRLIFGILAKLGKKIIKHPLVEKYFYILVREKDYYRANSIMKKTMANLISIDLRNYLSNINIPVLIIWGKQDKTTPVFNAYIFEKGLKCSELVILDSAGHSPFATHATDVYKLIDRFI